MSDELSSARLTKCKDQLTDLKADYAALLAQARLQYETQTNIEAFALRALEIHDLEALCMLLDDTLRSQGFSHWKLHYPAEHLSEQLTSRVSYLSKQNVRRYLASATLGLWAIDDCPPIAATWLLGPNNKVEILKFIPLEANFEKGFVVAGGNNPNRLQAPFYHFVAQILKLRLAQYAQKTLSSS